MTRLHVLPPAPAAFLVVAVLLAAVPVARAQPAGPRQLFPEPPPVAAPGDAAPEDVVPADDPAALPPQDEAAETPSVAVAPLAPPGLGALGLPAAAEALGRPLWGAEAAPGLAAALSRLPERVDDPTLRRLQRDLLLAPGPRGGAGAEVLRARSGRLIAMGEAEAAADLLALAPDGEAGLALPKAEALLAADRIEPGCALVDAAAADDAVWDGARLACAAIRGDAARVELDLALQAERGRPVDPLLASLAAALAGGGRAALKAAPPPDPLLLPLLRRTPLQPEPKVLAAASPAVRRAVALNPNVPAGLAPPAAEPPPPVTLPGLDGRPVADWRKALGSVAEARRARWLAALDGLGAAPPDPVLDDLPETSRRLAGGRVDLAAWRGLERAAAGAERGPVLLHLLLLLDGRPHEASPLALRAALASLRDLGLEAEARAVAAAGLAGKG